MGNHWDAVCFTKYSFTFRATEHGMLSRYRKQVPLRPFVRLFNKLHLQDISERFYG
jgi:hypothetical protein